MMSRDALVTEEARGNAVMMPRDALVTEIVRGNAVMMSGDTLVTEEVREKAVMMPEAPGNSRSTRKCCNDGRRGNVNFRSTKVL